MKSVFRISLLSVFLMLFAFADQVQGYYDPGTGRFLNRDPIAERGGANIYAFVRNAPVNYIDQLGLKGVIIRVTLNKDDVNIDKQQQANLTKRIAKLKRHIEFLSKKDDDWWNTAIANKSLTINGKYYPKHGGSKAAYLAACNRELESKIVSLADNDKQLSAFQTAVEKWAKVLTEDYDVMGTAIHGDFIGKRPLPTCAIAGGQIGRKTYADFMHSTIAGSGNPFGWINATCGGWGKQGIAHVSRTPRLTSIHDKCSADLTTFKILKVAGEGDDQKVFVQPFEKIDKKRQFDGWDFEE